MCLTGDTGLIYPGKRICVFACRMPSPAISSGPYRDMRGFFPWASCNIRATRSSSTIVSHRVFVILAISFAMLYCCVYRSLYTLCSTAGEGARYRNAAQLCRGGVQLMNNTYQALSSGSILAHIGATSPSQHCRLSVRHWLNLGRYRSISFWASGTNNSRGLKLSSFFFTSEFLRLCL